METNNIKGTIDVTPEKASEHQTRIFGINIQTVIPFISYRWFTLFGISAIVIISGFTMYFMKGGFPLGIDFKGGIKVDVRVNNPDVNIKDVRKIFTDAKMEADVNTVGNASDRQYMITLPIISSQNANDEVQMVTTSLGSKYGSDNIIVKSSEKVDARIGQDFGMKAFYLILISAGLILVYVIFRFDLFYGAGAIGALFHDVLFMLSCTLLLNIPIDLTIVAAILTIIGYSTNDTIVVFDRIRELHALNKDGDYEAIIDRSITQTLSRTIITSLTVFLVVLAIFLWGGVVMKNFALLLLIGVIDGTYSSIFIAAPITYMLRKSMDKNLKGSKANLKKASAAQSVKS
jgi:preprotein translocase subunit SecF